MPNTRASTILLIEFVFMSASLPYKHSCDLDL